MPTILPDYEYDIFISYRHNDNLDGWVTNFVESLEKELRGTLKESLTIYFDKNPHDGLQQHHEVDESLKEKLKSLILIPIVSQTYCDPKAFAWEHELIPFIQQATEDKLGLKTRVSGGNIASRVLPVKIHDIDNDDKQLFEEATGSAMRSLDFIYKESGVNRPLRPADDRNRNQEQIDYRNQVNKVANAIKEIITSLQGKEQDATATKESAPEIKVTGAPVNAKRRPRRFRIPTITKVSVLTLLSTILLLALLTLPILHFNETPTESLTYRATILAPKETSFNTAFGGNLALSPDGTSLAFIANDSLGISHLYLRPIDQIKARGINGTDNAFLPFWSPDNRYIGFFADGKLKKVDIVGGLPQTLCDAEMGRGGSWSKDGTIIFSPGILTPLSRVSSAGGRAVPLTTYDSINDSHRYPHFLPDGKHYFYTSLNQNEVRLASLDSTTPTLIFPFSAYAEYANGHILYAHNGTLMAQPITISNFQIEGEAFPIAENIHFDATFMKGSFSISQNGNLVYQNEGIIDGTLNLVWRDRTGKDVGSIKHDADRGFLTFSISPEESRIVVSHSTNNNLDNWLYEINRDVWTRFTFDIAEDRSPIWSPDGKTIVFASDRNNRRDLFQRAASGAGSEELLLQNDQMKNPTDWSRDGKYILYHTARLPNADIWILPMQENERKPYAFLQTEFYEAHATFSPDSRWIAYQSDESGQDEIYIQPFPGPGARWQVSTSGGSRPHWRGDGKELFFYGTNSNIMSAETQLGKEAIEIGSVKGLFHLPFSTRGYAPNADIYQATSDGQHFLIQSAPDSNTESEITLVVNWLGEIKKRKSR